MSIVKMKRFSLLVFDSDKDSLLHNLQKFNFVHFQDLYEDSELMELGLDRAKVPEKIVEIDEEINKIKFGIDTLAKYDTRASGIKAMKIGKETLEFSELEEKAKNIDYLPVYQALKENNANMEALRREKEQYQGSLSELRPWVNLDVAINSLSSIERCDIFLGTIPKRQQAEIDRALLDTQYTYFEIVGEEKGNLYVLVMTPDIEAETTASILRSNNFSEVKLGIKGIPQEEVASLQNNIANIDKKLEDCKELLVKLSEQLPGLEMVYDYLMNMRLRSASSEKFLTAGDIQVIEGYVPADRMDTFVDTVKASLNNVFYLETQEVDKDDPEIPILLSNSTFASAFEDLTEMYSYPKYNEIDPTPLLSFFYAFFFGMMVADFGYGLLLFIGTFVMLKTFNLSDKQKATIRFYMFGSMATMFWGLIFGSFFGGIITMPGLLDPLTEYNKLLLVSIGLGVIHIFYALGIKAYLHIRDKRPLEALYDAGFWYMALGGAIALLLVGVGTLPGNVQEPAKWVMIIGMIGIVLTNGRDAAGIGGKLGSGLYSLYGISGYIGDFVSYSRLMALGLSGGYIAYAINLMVSMLFDQGFIGIIFGIVVFVVGQLFNIFLSVLSGYVHSIRLTYVEFFGKFYEGGGKPFKKFRSQPKYINLK